MTLNLQALTPEMVNSLPHDEQIALLAKIKWRMTARPNQLPPEGDWTEWGLMAGRGFGKLLCKQTPVPTPTGWTTMGELKPGSVVFDEAGKPCNVVAVYEPPVSKAYRLTFSDSATLTADADHQWVTWEHADRKAYLRSQYTDPSRFPDNWPQWRSGSGEKGPEIRTTQQIVDTLVYGKRGDTNHCIPCCAPLELPDADLSVPPYVLGYWLGNGSAHGPTVTCHHDDRDELMSYMRADGVGAAPHKHPQNFGLLDIVGALRDGGQLLNKHIPTEYLRASAVQRLDLLRGLMDSDGNIEHGNTVAFVNTDKALIDAVSELVHSLGMKTRVWSGVGKIYGVEHKPFWRVQFTPTVNPFRLKRKAGRIGLGGAQSLRNHHRMIVKAEEIEPVPMCCITVDSRNSMYLVGREMIPTHNTMVGANWIWEAAWDDPLRLPSAVIAPTQSDVRYTCFEGVSGLLATIPPELVAEYNKSDLILTLKNGAIIRGFSAEKPERLRGPQFCRGWLDELAAWQNAQDTWDMFKFGLRLGPKPQLVWTSTPKPTELVRNITKPAKGRIIVRGSSYDNRANLSAEFFRQLEQFEGTQLGKQEIHGELIDPEEAGIIKRSWFRLWPANAPLPRFDCILMSLDTAFTEATIDKKGNADYSACTVWGVFSHEKRTNVMLLDCWQEQLGLPDLIERVRKEMQIRYGDNEQDPVIKPMFGPSRPMNAGRRPDMLLIEDKGSGISLRQSLEREGIIAYAYNPGRADKLARLHQVSHVFARRLVWLPESQKREGVPRTWVEPLLSQLCAFTGSGSIKHDDLVDATTQAIRLLLDKSLLVMAEQERQRVGVGEEVERGPKKPVNNPYAT